MVGGEVGLTSRLGIRRIVARGVSLANAEDLGKWMGASEYTIFNF